MTTRNEKLDLILAVARPRIAEHWSGCLEAALRGYTPATVARLDELGVTHGGIVDAPYGSGLSFRDPDGIALEFFAPPSA